MAKEKLQAAGQDCLLERKAIKNIHIRVLPPDGAVHISAPLHLSIKEIRAFAQARVAWIKKCKAEILARPKAPDPFAVQSVFGKLYKVRFIVSPKCWIRLEGGELQAGMPQGLPPQTWEAMLRAWHKYLLETDARPILEHWRKLLSFPPVTLAVRAMKRRWGTCYPERRKILLNSRLAEKPRDCLAYVVTHELLHLRHPNHGLAFKKELANHWPNWRQLDAILDNKPGSADTKLIETSVEPTSLFG